MRACTWFGYSPLKKIYEKALIILICSGFISYANAQNKLPNKGSVGIATTTPNASAILDVDTTGKGILIPRMTKAKRDAIASPALSLLVYQTDNTPGFYYYNGSIWRLIFDPSLVFIKGTNLYVGNNPGAATGDSNSVVGNGLLLNTTGYSNTVAGDYAMALNTTGARITAMGYYTEYNGKGFENSAFGYEALMNSTGGGFNTAIGTRTLMQNNGIGNTAVGENALIASTASLANTALGAYALQSTQNGGYNTGAGQQSLRNNTSGQFNTALGFGSMATNITGSYNTAIGDSADISKNGFTNATALGYKATATASNQVMLGNTAVTSVKAAGSFVIYSDGRFKKNIKNNVPGLEFIKLLKPVTYNYNLHELDAHISPVGAAAVSNNINNAAYEAAIQAKEKKLYTGLVAQDVEAAANKLGYDFSGLYKPQNGKDAYGLSYADFVAPLVKAMQQLSEMNDKKDKLIADLNERVAKLENASLASSNTSGIKAQQTIANKITLEQNAPNPFANSTTINYHIPASVKNAQITVANMNGATLMQQPVNTAENSVMLNMNNLAAGTYTYTLFCDGKAAATRKMIINK